MSHKLQELVDNLKRRDKDAVESMTGWMGDGMTIEKRIALADGRAMDALMAISSLASYIMEQEAAQEKP